MSGLICMSIYFDNNASTRLSPAVLDAMLPYLEGPYGNPSSLHRYGRAARDAVEAARTEVAGLVGSRPEEVTWTSGGTESNNLAIKGTLAGSREITLLLYCATEHAAIIEPAEAARGLGWTVEVIPVGDDGMVDLEAFRIQLGSGPLRLAALMLANNETGVIQDVAAAACLVHDHGAWLLVDAVQAAGKISVDFRGLGADLLSVSAHKLHGPRGIGALIRRTDLDLVPLHHGGGQEAGLRGGTENVAAIVGFGAAAALARQELDARAIHMERLLQRLEGGLRALPGVRIFTSSSPRLPNTVLFSMPGYEGEGLLMALDRKGIAVSSGSACHSGRGEPSHVLLAMGVSREKALGAVRISLSKDNSAAEVDRLLAILAEMQLART